MQELLAKYRKIGAHFLMTILTQTLTQANPHRLTGLNSTLTDPHNAYADPNTKVHFLH